jgi:hypothetical protein
MKGPMSRIGMTIFLVAVLTAASIAVASDEFNRDPDKARIITEDLDRFWAAWDLAEQQPDQRREIFLEQYLQAGTSGLERMVELRIDSVDRLLAAIDAHPNYYASLRQHTPRAQAAAEPVRDALHELKRVLPKAVFPDTYIMIGRMNSGGTIDEKGLLVGFEMYGMAPDTPTDELGTWHRSVISSTEVLPMIIMHELIHYQQWMLYYQQAENEPTGNPNLLWASLHEGSTEFMIEVLMGSHSNVHLLEWALPGEVELWAVFREVMHSAEFGDSEFGDWLYGGAEIDGRPADLGYFMGYRIAQAYYERAEDKAAAIRAIIGMTDAEAFLRASGYAEKMAERMAEKKMAEGQETK